MIIIIIIIIIIVIITGQNIKISTQAMVKPLGGEKG
jgi:hypothetical protein